MSTFILDGRVIQDRYPGIGRYGFNLARALAESFPRCRFRVLFHEGAQNTRFDFSQLSRFDNIELALTQAGIFAPWRVFRGGRDVTAGARLWHSPFYTLPWGLPLPTVVTLPDLIPLLTSQQAFHLRVVYRILNQLSSRRADEVITFSAASQQSLERLLGIAPGKVSVVPLAADASFSPASLAEIERVRSLLDLPSEYVLYLGSNKPHKNLVRLIEAWNQVSTSATLVIAGAWDARYSEPENIAARLEAGSRIRFRKNVGERELAGLISGARVFVYPSLLEGFGLPPLEAMACGTPVACANIPAIAEVVADAGLLFDPLDASDIAAKLSLLLEDHELRKDLSLRGLGQAARYSWAATARKTMRVYENVLARRDRIG